MSKNYYFIFAAIIALANCSQVKLPEPPVFSDVRNIKINITNEQQEMDGFGASDCWRGQMVGKYWPQTKKEQIADWLFSKEVDAEGNPKGIGLSMWRFNIGAGSAEQGIASGIGTDWKRAECFQKSDGTYDWTKQEGQRWFLKAAKSRGVEKFLMFSLSAPVHMTENGVAYATKVQSNINIADDKMDDFAEFLAKSIDKLKTNYGITFSYLSPVNEPQWDWSNPGLEGTPATNKNLSDLTKAISNKLNAKSLSTQIVLGEAGMIGHLSGNVANDGRDNQINDLWTTSSSMHINNLPNVARTISGHSYYSVWPLTTLVSEREKLATKLKQISGLKYWQTEYCIMESPGTTEIPNGNGNKRDLGIKTALFVARIIHNDIAVAGASAWQWWTALTRADYKDGLVYLDDGTNNGSESNDNYCRTDGYARDSKLMWALGNYSFFVRPGMIRVDIENQDHHAAAKDVMLSAYKDKATKKLVIVAVNVSSSDRKYKLDNSVEVVSNQLIPYITSESYNLKKMNAIDCSEFTIPAKSIVTFVGTLK